MWGVCSAPHGRLCNLLLEKPPVSVKLHIWEFIHTDDSDEEMFSKDIQGCFTCSPLHFLAGYDCFLESGVVTELSTLPESKHLDFPVVFLQRLEPLKGQVQGLTTISQNSKKNNEK